MRDRLRCFLPRLFSAAGCLALLALLAPAVHGATTTLRPTPLDEAAPFRRFLWVTRWDYNSAADIEKICYNAASARFTDLLFQVRGEATVFFNSPYEPWAWELSGKDSPSGVGINPGWDPLAVAIREGRRRGLRVHAYVNVMPCWAQSTDPPASSGQIYKAKPDWLMVDSKGRRIKPRGFYACVDPGLPEVRAYLARLIGRLTSDYAVDGVHLDYIRYPFETGDYSFHPRVTEAYEAQTGKPARAQDEDWQAFRRTQISSTVREINQAVKAARPGTEVSAAVIARTDVGRTEAGQDPLGWISRGDIDAIAPMVYVQDTAKFNELVRPYTDGPARSKVWVGIQAIDKNKILLNQIEDGASREASGIAVFSYESLFKEHRTTQRAIDVYRSFVNYRPAAQPMLELKRPPAAPTDRTSWEPEAPGASSGPDGAKRARPGMKMRVGP